MWLLEVVVLLQVAFIIVVIVLIVRRRLWPVIFTIYLGRYYVRMDHTSRVASRASHSNALLAIMDKLDAKTNQLWRKNLVLVERLYDEGLLSEREVGVLENYIINPDNFWSVCLGGPEAQIVIEEDAPRLPWEDDPGIMLQASGETRRYYRKLVREIMWHNFIMRKASRLLIACVSA